ncbi:hypothetical protein DFH06DRAFT_1099062 [Mycena polygramma]|nr:hypothetical protein DFH06DRAFT_1099062 [Mycena polygramma]
MAAAAESDLKVEQLWFSTDAVVLRAQGRIFRVFAATLKQKSSVFADMFTFPQPPSADVETMDGVPVVTLHDDPAELEVFLRAIFDSDFFMPPPAETKLEDTLGILRLAHKYDVPYLRRRALQHLVAIYPTQLSAYDRRPGNGDLPAGDFYCRVATIAAATEVGALWLLPVAYYDLCKSDLLKIVEDPCWLTLGRKEQNTFLVGYQMQIRQTPKILSFLSISTQDSDDSECMDSAECNRNRLDLNFRLISQLSPYMNWPLDLWSEAIFMELDGQLCDGCLTEARAHHGDARQACWDELPGAFGLPDWATLEGMRQEAL